MRGSLNISACPSGEQKLKTKSPARRKRGVFITIQLSYAEKVTDMTEPPPVADNNKQDSSGSESSTKSQL
jgi:hypothetical protein